jgi:ABC-type methionine transport system ATPase subunit
MLSNIGIKFQTRILVTHGVHWLPMVDRIVVLNNGVISEIGSYVELISHDGDFARFLHQYFQQDDDDDDPESNSCLYYKLLYSVLFIKCHMYGIFFFKTETCLCHFI